MDASHPVERHTQGIRRAQWPCGTFDFKEAQGYVATLYLPATH